MTAKLLKSFSLFLFLLFLFEGQKQLNAQGLSTAKKTYELKEISNVPYYEKSSPLNSDLTQLNLIIPQGAKNPPVFIWVGGGAWAYVNRNQEMDLCRHLAKQGILMISVGHRLSPALLFEPKRTEGVQHPAHIKDLAQAFRWVYDHAEEYDYDQKNIFVGGFSSGAHLAALLAADGRYLEQQNLSTQNIKAIIPIGGGYDIVHYQASQFKEDPTMIERHIHPVFGTTEAAFIDASPTSYLDHFDTPMLMLSESETYEYSVIFEQALKAKGIGNYQVLNCHDETHASLWKKLSWEENCIQRDFIIAYINALKE